MTAMERIVSRIVPEWVSFQLEKSKDYNSSTGVENADVLGVKGQFADIWRKIGKLKKSLWDDEELRGEQPREILMDLIGHCFLTIDMLDRAEKERAGLTKLEPYDPRQDPKSWLGPITSADEEREARARGYAG